jgi:hypothetical protein
MPGPIAVLGPGALAASVFAVRAAAQGYADQYERPAALVRAVRRDSSLGRRRGNACLSGPARTVTGMQVSTVPASRRVGKPRLQARLIFPVTGSA